MTKYEYVFPTLKMAKEYAKEHGFLVCSCYCNYPNPFFKPKRCDKSIPVSNDGFERAVKKQYCLRKKGEEHDKG